MVVKVALRSELGYHRSCREIPTALLTRRRRRPLLPLVDASPESPGFVSTERSTFERVPGIDAARGAAMLFVCLSHFPINFFPPGTYAGVRDTIWTVSMVASPTFMLISGMMLGLLYEVRRDTFSRVSRVLAGRGLFLLTIGHALILITVVPTAASWGAGLGRGFITDVIGAAIIVGPLIVQRTSARFRVLLALGLMTLCWVLVTAWTPLGKLESAGRYLLVGPWSREMTHNFPLIPWLAVYFAGTVVGQVIGKLQRHAHSQQIEVTLLNVGLCAFGAAVVVKVGFWLAVNQGVGSLEQIDVLYRITSPFNKLPPSPVYVAFYGGIGLLMAGALVALERRGSRLLTTWLALLGRCSLFVFLIQFYIFYLAFHFIKFPYQKLWPMYFALTMGLITTCAWRWEKAGYNRWFNVLDWRRAPRSVTPARVLEPAVRA
jgi:uncharacterized membrane protein